MNRVQEMGYELGIFTSAQLRSPEFNFTVFVNVPNLRMGSEGANPAERDKNLTDDWSDWYKKEIGLNLLFHFYSMIHLMAMIFLAIIHIALSLCLIELII